MDSMEVETQSLYFVRLFRFMRLHDVNMISFQKSTESSISAAVGWVGRLVDESYLDDDVQEIRWHIQNIDHIDDGLSLGEYVLDHGWLSNDLITISPNKLREFIGWPPDRFDAAIKALLSIQVSMIDEGEETDMFFIHI